MIPLRWRTLRDSKLLANDVALLAVFAVILSLFALVLLAAMYGKRRLEQQYRDGPWTQGTVTRSWTVGRDKDQQHVFYAGTVKFETIVAGRRRACLADVNLGRHDPGYIPDLELRLAPRPGRCGDVATAYD